MGSVSEARRRGSRTARTDVADDAALDHGHVDPLAREVLRLEALARLDETGEERRWVAVFVHALREPVLRARVDLRCQGQVVP